MARAHATVRDLSTGQIACCFFFSAIIFACAMAKVRRPPAARSLYLALSAGNPL